MLSVFKIDLWPCLTLGVGYTPFKTNGRMICEIPQETLTNTGIHPEASALMIQMGTRLNGGHLAKTQRTLSQTS